jgi:microcystin-dependent protein
MRDCFPFSGQRSAVVMVQQLSMSQIYRAASPVGKSVGGHTDVALVGNSDATAIANRRPKHKHTVNDPGHFHGIGAQTSPFNVATLQANINNGAVNQVNTSTNTTGITVGTSTDTADTMPYMVLNYIIKT